MLALDKVSLCFPNSGLFAIEGKSGSGKSTLLNLLSLLETPTSGKITWNENDLQKLPKKNQDAYRNEAYGFVYQRFNLLEEENAEFNIALPLLIRGENERTALTRSNELLKEWGLGYLAKRKAKLLSGGEKQRVSLLRALIKNPSVIFADEPTGALDGVSASVVMDALKEASKKRLVIVVSHNEALMKKYAEGLVRLSDGKVVENTIPKGLEVKRRFVPAKRKPPTYGWEIFLSRLKEDKKKNILAFLGSFLTFSTILLSLGFILGSKDSLAEEKKNSLLLYSASLSQKTTTSLPDSPLSVVRNLRPSFTMAKEYLPSSCSFHNDYSYFFPSSLNYSFLGKERSEISFAPLYDETLVEFGSHAKLKGESLGQDFSSCLVNEEFSSLYGNDVIGKSLSFARETAVSKDGKTSSVKIAGSFLIKGVVKEFSFLNSPRVYYSYHGLEQTMSNTFLPGLEMGEGYNAISLIGEAKGDEAYGSYTLLVFAHGTEGFEDVRRLSALSVSNGLSLTSYYVSLLSSFDALHTALSASLTPFLALESFGVVFIIGAIAFSSFLCRKKEAAILLSLGARLQGISSSYVFESLLISLLAMAVSLLSYPLLSMGLNAFLLSFTKIPSLISLPLESYLGIPFLIPVCSIAFSLIIAYLGSAIPFLGIRKKHLSEELSEE